MAILCIHCRQPIPWNGTTLSDQVTCPVCGLRFPLEEVPPGAWSASDQSTASIPGGGSPRRGEASWLEEREPQQAVLAIPGTQTVDYQEGPPSNSEQTTEWYYARNRTKCGPFSFSQLQEKAAEGSLQPGDMVWQHGTPRWLRASGVPDLIPQAPGSTKETAEPTIQEPVWPAVAGYEILGILGQGGMGVVYKARQVDLKRVVALKMIRAAGHAGPAERARFRLEAEAVARLQHPNIVQIHDIGEQDGLPYFSLEFVDGISLAKQLAGTPQPPREAAPMVETLARAMHYAHERGIVHRDLKPANVLLQIANCQLPIANLPNDNLQLAIPKIADFGLAKHLDEDSGQTQTGQVMGTPSYMAPEQAAAQTPAIGPLTDVYALGAILYEMLTGRPPFKGASVRDTLDQVCSQEPVPPSRLQPRLPRDVETICLKCLQKEPRKRYASAEALAQDVHRFLNGEPIQARPIGWAERLVKGIKRRPAMAGLIAVSSMALIGLVIGGVGWALVDKARTDRHIEELTKENHRRTLAEQEATKQKNEAVVNSKLAEKGRRKADAATRKLGVANEEILRRSIRMTTSHAERLMKDGDLSASLLYAVDALLRDRKDSPEQTKHRLRIAAALRQFPRLVHLGFHSGGITHLEMSPDGRWVLTAGQDGTARVWTLTDGKLLTEQARMVHKDAINSATFSPDGRRVVTGSDDQTARVWDAASGRPLTDPLKLRYPVLHVAFHPITGREVVAVSGNKYSRSHTVNSPPTVDYQRIVTGIGPNGVPMYTMIPIVRPGNPTMAQAFGYAQVWNTTTGKPVGKPLRQPGWISHAAFSPDGRRIATAGGSMEGANWVQVWEVDAGKKIPSRFKHPYHVQRVSFSPDGSRIVSACGPLDQGTGQAQVWDVAKEQPVGRPMKHSGAVTQAWFSPNGHSVVTASADGAARVWDADTGEPATPPLRHKGRLAGAWFSPDGRRVLTASKDGSARVWDAGTGKPLSPLLRHAAALTSAAFGGDGHRVLTGDGNGGVRLWDLVSSAYESSFFKHHTILQPAPRSSHTLILGRRTARTVQSLGDLVVTGALFSPDGRYVFTGSGSRTVDLLPGGGRAQASTQAQTNHLCVWEAATGKPMASPLKHSGPVTALSVSPDGRRVVTIDPVENEGPTSTAQGIRLWEVPSGKVLAHRQVKSGIKGTVFTPDGRCCFVAVIPKKSPPNRKGPPVSEVQIINIQTNEPVVPPLEPEGTVELVSFGAGGSRLATVTIQQTSGPKNAPRFRWVIAVWDLKNKGRLAGAPVKRDHPVTRIALSSDGDRLVAYSPAPPAPSSAVFGLATPDPEGKAYLYEVRTGKGTVLTHAGVVKHAAFSPDSRLVVTCSADHTARVWEAASGKPVTPALEHQGPVNSAAFGRGGLVVTASNDNTARVWDVATGEMISPPLPHQDWVLDASFDSTGRRVVTAGCDGTARVWEFSLQRPAEPDLGAFVQLLAGHQIDAAGGLTVLDAKTLSRTWEKLRKDYPAAFTSSPETVLVWYREEAEEADNAGDWFGFVFHLDRLIRAQPDDWVLRARRARAYLHKKQWSEAAANYAKAIELGSNNCSVWYALALVQLQLGKTEEYRRTCAGMLKQFGQTQDTGVAEMVIDACTLVGDALSDWGALVELAEKQAAVKAPNSPFSPDLLGMALYRAGRFQDAADKLKNRTGSAGFFLAMAQYRLNRKEDARKTLEKVIQDLERATARMSSEQGSPRRLAWNLRLKLRLLRQEAEAMIKEKGR